MLESLQDAQSVSPIRYATEADVIADISTLLDLIPTELLGVLRRFSRVDSRAGALVLRDIPLGSIVDLPTPDEHGDYLYTPTEDHILSLVLAAALGDPIGYSTQQQGRIVNDIMPLKERAWVANSSNGFEKDFGHHTEDSFFTVPPTFFTLRCVRDPASLGVSISPLDVDELDVGDVAQLFISQFEIPPNPLQIAWSEFETRVKPILFGERNSPYMRFNHATISSTSTQGGKSVQRLLDHLDAQCRRIDMQPGDMAIVDNYRVAHSRAAYSASLDGADRWLFRIVAYASLRQLRTSANVTVGGGNVLSPRASSVV